MTPQEWIESTKRRWDSGHLYEGAQHLAAALEEIDRLRAEAVRVVVPEFDANDALHFAQSFEEAGNLGKQAEFLRGWLAAELRAEVERNVTSVLVDHARGVLPHRYEGACPDSVEGPDVRDPECPVCRAIDSASGRAVALDALRAQKGGGAT